jgi:hypothetical protein
MATNESNENLILVTSQKRINKRLIARNTGYASPAKANQENFAGLI